MFFQSIRLDLNKELCITKYSYTHRILLDVIFRTRDKYMHFCC